MALRHTFLWTFVLFVLLAVGPLGGSAHAASTIKTFFCPGQRISISSSAGDEDARFRMTLRSDPSAFGSSHAGGLNFVFADGSVRFLRATTSDFVFNDGNLVEIFAEATTGPKGTGTWFFHILPYVEQENLYEIHGQDDANLSFTYDAQCRLMDGAQPFPRR